MRYEAVSTHWDCDTILIVKNLSKQFMGSDVKRAKTSSMTNHHDVCDLFKVSGRRPRKNVGRKLFYIQTVKRLTGFSRRRYSRKHV